MSELAVQEQAVDPATMELVIVNGDLSKLNPQQRIAWYKARCEAAGLDPRTEPFQYIRLQNGLKLYATKAATDQLIANRKLTVAITERRHDQTLGVYEVQCRVTFPDGHWVEDFAAVPIKGLVGDGACNAMMKTCTKAKRRTVLSACGLGMHDETEVETIPGAQVHNPGPHALEATDEPEPDVGPAFDGFLDAMTDRANEGWLDSITSKKTGKRLSANAELISRWKLREHLLKWARSMDWIRAGTGTDDRFMALAHVWHEHMAEFTEEAQRYCRGIWKAAFKEAKEKAAKARNAAPREAPEVLTLAEENAAIDELLTTEAGARG
jgi:hypothetical protein